MSIYYMKNPVDFDKQLFFITFIWTRFFSIQGEKETTCSKAIIFFIVALTTHRLVYDQDDQFY